MIPRFGNVVRFMQELGGDVIRWFELSGTPTDVPPAGSRDLYPKSDGFYWLNSAGLERKLLTIDDLPSEGFDAENKDVVTILKGQAVAMHVSGIGVIRANATTNVNPAIGLMKVDVGVGFAGSVITDGVLDIPDWTAATGAAALAAKKVYFLDSVSGMITYVPLTTVGRINQPVGRSVSTTKMEVEISDPIKL